MGYVFVSGWKREPGHGGIVQYSMNPQTGELKKVQAFFEDVSFNVSYLDEKRDILYALNEVADSPSFRAGGGGSLYIFRLDRDTGTCRQTEVVPLYTACPSNLSISTDRSYMIVTGHGSRGHVTKLEQDALGKYHPVILYDDTPVMLLSLKPDGSIGEILDVDKHTGCGPTVKQITARPHSAALSPSGGLVAVCDKGNDHIYMYQIDRKKNKLVLCSKPAAAPPGTEPRYCVYHPTLPYLYHNCENSTEIFAYRYDEDGALSPAGIFDAVEEPSICENCRTVEQQGLCMDPSGRYLYDVIHGPNMIAVFQIDQNDGTLTLVQNQPVGYDWPRGAAISPDGRFLIVTCVRGKKVAVFRIEENGLLTHTQFACDQDNASYATFWDI